MIKAAALQGLGIYAKNDRVYLFGATRVRKKTTLHLQQSLDGNDFRPIDDPQLLDLKNKPFSSTYFTSMRISSLAENFLMCVKEVKPTITQLTLLSSTDLIHWKVDSSLPKIKEQAMLVPNYVWNGKYVMFFGEDTIKIAMSGNLLDWEIHNTPLLTPRPNEFDYGALSVGCVSTTDEGIVVIYCIQYGQRNESRYGFGVALFDKNNPQNLLWRSPTSFFDQPDEFSYKAVHLVGIADDSDAYISYWQIENKQIVTVSHPKQIKKHEKRQTSHLKLKKLERNPIMHPIATHHWESKAVFNPAVLNDNGKIHLLYRALGDNDSSVIGYASTIDGVSIDERLDKPVYVPTQPFELNGGEPVSSFNTAFFSGGLYGGCEDPRITKIGNKLYMTYVAYNGAHPPKVALSSIKYSDFKAKKWNWSTPVIISRPGVVDKNACILPEKINGKYVIFHRIFPNILIDFVDNLDFDGHSTFLKGEYSISPRASGWDSRKVGAGPPPIKTKDGWLLIYHAVGDQDPSRYKMGAMLLDLNDPRKVIARSNSPILEPEEWYENNGFKFGVAYPCGATVFKDELHVYYGGSDQVICLAKTPLTQFLDQLKHDATPHLSTVSFKPVAYAG